MNTKEDVEAVDALTDVLRQSRIFTLDPSRRRSIAVILHAGKVTADQLNAIWAEAQETCGAKDPQGVFAQAVQSAEKCHEIFADIQAREVRKIARSGKVSSDLKYCSSKNPYGWQDEKSHQREDHSRPGEWNAYRQSYNLTEDQLLELLETDPRLHGCSREEVLGSFDKDRIKGGKARQPSKIWDAGVVEIVSQPIKPIFEVKERDVFGA